MVVFNYFDLVDVVCGFGVLFVYILFGDKVVMEEC